MAQSMTRCDGGCLISIIHKGHLTRWPCKHRKSSHYSRTMRGVVSLKKKEKGRSEKIKSELRRGTKEKKKKKRKEEKEKNIEKEEEKTRKKGEKRKKGKEKKKRNFELS